MRAHSPSDAPLAPILLILIVAMLALPSAGVASDFRFGYTTVPKPEIEGGIRPMSIQPVSHRGLPSIARLMIRSNRGGRMWILGSSDSGSNGWSFQARGTWATISPKNAARCWFVSNTVRYQTSSRCRASLASSRKKKKNYCTLESVDEDSVPESMTCSLTRMKTSRFCSCTRLLANPRWDRRSIRTAGTFNMPTSYQQWVWKKRGAY